MNVDSGMSVLNVGCFLVVVFCVLLVFLLVTVFIIQLFLLVLHWIYRLLCPPLGKFFCVRQTIFRK